MKINRVLQSVTHALSKLNPKDVRESAAQLITLQLHASSSERYWQMESFFAPSETLSEAKRGQVTQLVKREGQRADGVVLHVIEKGMEAGPNAFIYDPANPEKLICDILERRPELNLALARQFSPFRTQVVQDLIRSVAKENALFSLATAVPSAIPFISLPWAVGEFASDTAFLTANQIRMAFMLAAASDRTVGYKEQKAEIASLFAGAFGWRALARELVGKIPFGGGLLPKAAIGYAATYVVGLSLERYYRLGYGFTPEERHTLYDQAFEKGKKIASSLAESYRERKAV